MVPAYVQGGTRVPPDQPEGGARGQLYSGCLWGTPTIQHPASNFQHQTPGQSQPKPHSAKSTKRKVEMGVTSRGKPPKVTSKPPQSVLVANRLRPQCVSKASPMRPQSHLKAAGHVSKELDLAFLEVFALQQTDDGSGVGRGAVGCRIG